MHHSTAEASSLQHINGWLQSPCTAACSSASCAQHARHVAMRMLRAALQSAKQSTTCKLSSADVALLCPAPGCMLQQQWCEGVLAQLGFATTDCSCICRRRQQAPWRHAQRWPWLCWFWQGPSCRQAVHRRRPQPLAQVGAFLQHAQQEGVPRKVACNTEASMPMHIHMRGCIHSGCQAGQQL